MFFSTIFFRLRAVAEERRKKEEEENQVRLQEEQRRHAEEEERWEYSSHTHKTHIRTIKEVHRVKKEGGKVSLLARAHAVILTFTRAIGNARTRKSHTHTRTRAHFHNTCCCRLHFACIIEY